MQSPHRNCVTFNALPQLVAAVLAAGSSLVAGCGDVAPVGGAYEPATGAGGDGSGGSGAGEARDCSEEVCDGLDNDCDGAVDEALICACVDDGACYGGPPATRGVGACRDGWRECDATGEFWRDCDGWTGPGDEVCDNGADDDCDGVVDEGCDGAADGGPGDGDPDGDGPGGDEPFCMPGDPGCPTRRVPLSLDGDCLTVRCPEEAPYPVGCDVRFHGGDERGCVASRPDRSEVYFQEGNVCNAGHLEGDLYCSDTPGGGLDARSCPIDKPDPIYVGSAGGCPDRD